jgi:hypothetical protein
MTFISCAYAAVIHSQVQRLIFRDWLPPVALGRVSTSDWLTPVALGRVFDIY